MRPPVIRPVRTVSYRHADTAGETDGTSLPFAGWCAAMTVLYRREAELDAEDGRREFSARI